MTDKHTPGPWEIAKQSGCLDDEEMVGVVGPSYQTASGYELRRYVAQYVETKNARLISAAPDLLEALQMCLRYMEYGEVVGCAVPTVAKARAAIKKATGE